MKKVKILLLIAFLVSGIIACEKMIPAAANNDELLDGPVDGLSYEDNRRFLAGDVAFNDEIFTAQRGLGPLFVATSCGSCHAGDGKGHPFTTLTRFGQIDTTGNTYLHLGGPQLQNRAIPGYFPELVPAGATFSKFTPPANTGLGFIELVSDADILAMADPNDVNGDGISGVPNWIKAPAYSPLPAGAITNNGKYIGRFGKKAGTFDLLQQTVNAYNQDIGITSTFEPKDTYTGLTIGPEVSDQTIRDVVFYLQTLKQPIQRTPNDPTVVQGKALFMQLGCENCHRQTLRTGPSPVTALSNKTFSPYTERTPPLWGLGRSPNSQGGYYFLLHDGRARTIDDAILLHGGEATNSRNQFNTLTFMERLTLIKFLESL
jgi:CxxC motif-containing protein (DUF1111 family)